MIKKEPESKEESQDDERIEEESMENDVKSSMEIESKSSLNETKNEEVFFCEDNSDNPTLQMKLAWALGYPPSWHVIRIYPHPATPTNPKSFQDRIYAGDPKANVDTYMNHHSAMGAALNFVEGESTGYEQKGGQLLARQAKFKVNDFVEVFYEDDGQWYAAQVRKVKRFVDDIRYSVYYEEEDATQTNICEDLIRAPTHEKGKERKNEPSSSKKRKRKSTPDPSQRKITTFVAKKNKTDLGSKASTTKNTNNSTTKTTGDNSNDDEEAIARAKELGLPTGWTARLKTHGRYDIRSPDESHKFKTKRAAFDFLEEHPHLATKGKLDSKKKDSLKMEVDDGDPPWRRVGHKYIGKKITYPHPMNQTKKKSSKMTYLHHYGTITGWLSETDVDSEGNPAFLSERSGKPAKLFHISFSPETNNGLLFVDLEGYEVEKYLRSVKSEKDERMTDDAEDNSINDEKEEDSDEDLLPLREMVKLEKLRG